MERLFREQRYITLQVICDKSSDSSGDKQQTKQCSEERHVHTSTRCGDTVTDAWLLCIIFWPNSLLAFLVTWWVLFCSLYDMLQQPAAVGSIEPFSISPSFQWKENWANTSLVPDGNHLHRRHAKFGEISENFLFGNSEEADSNQLQKAISFKDR